MPQLPTTGQEISEEVHYRRIPEFPGYRAGADGSIWSCWIPLGRGKGRAISSKWKKLKGAPRKEDGRVRFTLRHKSGVLKRLYGSNFILFAFVGLALKEWRRATKTEIVLMTLQKISGGEPVSPIATTRFGMELY